MYKVNITSIRPHNNIEFFRYDADMYDYIEEQYINTGDLMSLSITISEDKSIENCEMLFDSNQVFQEYIKDPVIAYQEPIKVRYNQYNKIAVSINTKEIKVSKDLYNVYLRIVRTNRKKKPAGNLSRQVSPIPQRTPCCIQPPG